VFNLSYLQSKLQGNIITTAYEDGMAGILADMKIMAEGDIAGEEVGKSEGLSY
jgi:hypothetical protein